MGPAYGLGFRGSGFRSIGFRVGIRAWNSLDIWVLAV